MRRSQWRRPYRIKKKKSILRNRWFWRLVLFLVFVGEVIYILYFFPYFQIKEINISGNEKVKTEAIKNFVDAKRFFLVDSKKISENILANFPQIAEAKIDRKFPDKLILLIKEREAVANFCVSECFSIDKTGIIFEPVFGGNQLIKIYLEVGSRGNLKLGERAVAEDFLLKILETEKKLKEGVKVISEEVRVVSEDRFNLKTSENWEIYFSSKNDLSWQLTKLKAVLEKEISETRRKSLEYIDVRFGNLAPYKYLTE